MYSPGNSSTDFASLNSSLVDDDEMDSDYISIYPLDYRIIATLLQTLIFLLGISGNIVVIIVILRTKSLHSPTYTYLISLAVADLIVLLSAVPEAVTVHHIGKRWLIGQLGCSAFIFSSFLGINAGSLSILAFTVEQYVAVCGQSTTKAWLSGHTKTVICSLWTFSAMYCSPWFGLTEVRKAAEPPYWEQCELRLSRQLYLWIFGADFIIYYVIPLVTATVCYTRIAVVLIRTARYCGWGTPSQGSVTEESCQPISELSSSLAPAVKPYECKKHRWNKVERQAIPQSRKQVLRMLVIVVVLFAIAWLPFRGLLIYNSFATDPWIDLWYSFFAKTLIYFNSAMNPFLYNIMSRRFRLAFHRLLLCKKKGLVLTILKKLTIDLSPFKEPFQEVKNVDSCLGLTSCYRHLFGRRISLDFRTGISSHYCTLSSVCGFPWIFPQLTGSSAVEPLGGNG